MGIAKIIKNTFRALGFEIKKISSTQQKGRPAFPRTTMKESLDHLHAIGFRPDTIIDVGAANGTMELLDTFPKSIHILIEPLIEFEPDLKNICKQYNAKYIIAGAGSQSGKMTIHVHDDLLGSSTLNETDGSAADGAPREINIITLDELIEKFNISGTMLLKIDVQGAELNVLDGAKKIIAGCEVILLEVSFFKFLVEAPEFYDIITYMKQRGFVTYDVVDGHNRPLDNALAQKDILFVKENGWFRQSHHWATPEQRTNIFKK